MPKTAGMDLVFDMERDTKNKVRFKEKPRIDNPDQVQVVGTLYITKPSWTALGKPDILHVHIEAP